MENQSQPLGMGVVKRVPAPEHFNLGTLTPAANVPDVFMPSYNGVTPSYGIAIEMQDQQPACGAHSGAEVINILKGIERGSVVRVSPQYGWDLIKTIDGLSIESGTDIVSLMKSLTKGYCDFALLGNNVEESLTAYADAGNMTNDMQLNAVNNQLSTAYAFTANPTMAQLKAAIFAHKAVVMCVEVGDEFWSPSWAEKDILPLKTGRPIISGHFITAYAYDTQYIYFYNHWSAAWGRAGIGYFAENYLSHVIDMAATVDLTQTFTFTRTLEIGMSGTDVGILQMILKAENIPHAPNTTSYFGTVTKAAVTLLQQKYASQILTPAGLVVGTGIAAAHTLAFLNAKYFTHSAKA